MKQIPLTQGKVTLVDDEDYDWLMTWKWHASKKGNNFYAKTGVDGVKITMHRLLLCYPKSCDIDHWDHNSLNNQKANFKPCSHRENISNMNKTGASKYRGVAWDKQVGLWVSRIEVKGKREFLGRFEDEYDGHLAYQNRLKSL